MSGGTLSHGVYELRHIPLEMLRLAYLRTAADMRRIPLFELFIPGFYVLLGWILRRISLETDDTLC